MFPTNARQWQAWSNQHTETKANITNLQTFQPKLGGMREQKAGMIPNNVRSANWNEVLWKGYEQNDQLDTYLIPQHDQRELALFSRYILKDPNATGSNLLERAQRRIQEKRSGQMQGGIKHFQNTKKTPFNVGGVVYNVKQASETGKPQDASFYDPLYGLNV